MKRFLLLPLLLAAGAGATSTYSPTMIPVHFGVCKNGSFISTEHGGDTFTVASQAASGQQNIVLSSASGCYVGMVIAYTANSSVRSDFYTSKILAINSNTLTLEDNLECTIQTGKNVLSWYINLDHPSAAGANAIMDYAFRYMTNGNRLGDQGRILDKYKIHTQGEYTLIGTAAISDSNTNSFGNPSCKPFPSAVITCSASGDGISWTTASQASGSFSYDVCVNPGAAGGILNISLLNGSTHLLDTSYTSEGSSIKLFNGSFSSASTGAITLKITQTGTYGKFTVGHVRILNKIVASDNLNSGVHILIGDSWAAFQYMQDALAYHIPNATIYNSGTGGNIIAQVCARLDTAALNLPRYAWLFCGTNDYFNSDSASFRTGIQYFIRQCIAVNCKPIIFDCGVGYRTAYSGYAAEQLFDSSTAFALLTPYNQNLGSISTGWNDPLSKIRCKITAAAITGTDTSFPAPLLISDIPAAFWAKCRADSTDLRMFDESGNVIPTDREQISGVITYRLDRGVQPRTITLEGGSGLSYSNDVTAFGADAVSAFTFDESTGNYIDRTGKGNATVNVAGDITRGVAGKIGKAVTFAGGGGYLSIADRDDLTFGNSLFYVRGWIKTNVNTNNVMIYSKFATGQREYLQGLDGSDALGLLNDRYGNLAGTIYTYGYYVAPTANQWFFYVGSLRADKVASIYVNGLVVAPSVAGAGSYTGMVNGTAPVTIGTVPGAYTATGTICRVVAGTHYVTPIECASLYQYENNPHAQYTVGDVETASTGGNGIYYGAAALLSIGLMGFGSWRLFGRKKIPVS